MQHDLDVFDDWTVPLANIGALAKVARDAGLVGIVIDNESLVGLRVNYPYDVKFPNRTLEDYRAQTQLIGRKIMQAIVAEFPDAAVVVLRGPAGADPASPGTLVNREADSAQLLGPFFTGFVEGKVARSLLVDGGTDYGLRTAEQFNAAAAWRKTGLASAATDSAFLTDSLRDRLADLGQRVVRRARARRRPRQPAAQPAAGVRQHAGAVAARRRHLRLGVVRPDRPDQGDGDRAVRRRGGAGPGGGGDADRHARLGGARQRHRPAGPVLLDDRRIGAGADPGRPGHRQHLERHRAAQHRARGPERQLLGHLVGLHRGAGHRHLHLLRHHRRRDADLRRRHDRGRRLLLPGADRACRHDRPGGRPALPDQDPQLPGRRRDRGARLLADARRRQGAAAGRRGCIPTERAGRQRAGPVGNRNCRAERPC